MISLHSPISLIDYLCNLTMNQKKTSWRQARKATAPSECNWLVYSDGGTRADCSASAWIICAVADGTIVLVVVGGIFFPEPVSSFAAEAIALEEATKELHAWLIDP